ncbi:MAG TPA: hypothetical protein VJB66_03280 [Candidatus Nanoarchaeia archaeon]|nr:hypothetical protein [Candidatus Nanoarchaeia archaeon]
MRLDDMVYLKFIASFMIALILSLPLYSAQTLAALTVTKNSGSDNIEGYLDATGDTWVLKVLAARGSETVLPSQVKINGFPFKSCSVPGALGTECTTDVVFGPRDQGSRSIPLVLENSLGVVVERTDVPIVLDGKAPDIEASAVQTTGTAASVSFTVTEQPSACAGLKSVQIKYNGAVIKTIEGDALSDIKTGVCVPGSSIIKSVRAENELLTITASAAAQSLQIIAVDRLGNTLTKTISMKFDPTAPNVKADTLAIGASREFVPPGSVTTTVSVEVEEDVASVVTATLSGAGLTDATGSCQFKTTRNNLKVFLCTWNDISIDFDQSLALTIKASDGHYTTTRDITQSFQVDRDGPSLISFGIEHPINGEHFVGRVDNTFVAVFSETGSGVDPLLVRADFSQLAAIYVGSLQKPDNCTATAGRTTCVWGGISATSVVAGSTKTASISAAPDKVGNRADLTGGQVTVRRDDTAPVISRPQAIIQAQPRDFFQSGDEIFISFEVVEANGIRAFVDTHELIQGSELLPADCVQVTETPASATTGTPAGTTPSTPAVPVPGKFICSVTTPAIGQFNGNTVQVPLVVFDGAGNKGELTGGNALQFTIFGTDDDLQNPNFWSVGDVTLSPSALDAHLTAQTKQRLFATVQLNGPAGVDVLRADVVNCVATPDTVPIADKFMINNFRGSKNPTIVVEFDLFDATGGAGDQDGEVDEEALVEEVEITCTISLQSGRGTRAIQQVEQEEVTFKAKFFLTPYEDALSNLEDEIDDAKDDANRGLLKVIGILSDIFHWVQVICTVIGLFTAISQALDLLKVATDGAATAAAGTPAAPLGTALGIKTCGDATAVQYSLSLGIDSIKALCAIASCTGQTISRESEFNTIGDKAPLAQKLNDKGEPVALTDAELASRSATDSFLNAYLNYQRFILDSYNRFFLFPIPGLNPSEVGGGVGQHLVATSLYDNVALSVAGVCLPGIIYNVEKYRQIQCRYVGCLENEVKGGIATIESCRELKDYQECKYFYGELFQLVPFVNLFDNIIQVLQNLLKDPVGIVRAIVVAGCGEAWCPVANTGGKASGFCNFVGYTSFILNMINTLVSTWEQVQTTTQKDYCSQVGL